MNYFSSEFLKIDVSFLKLVDFVDKCFGGLNMYIDLKGCSYAVNLKFSQGSSLN